jgi:toluene monooxygenase system ferredoxin subunit
VTGYHPIGALADLWAGDLREVTIDGTKLVVLRVGDTVCAYADRCAHLGFPLSKGSLDGAVLTCAAHHWQYDATTGRGINPARACLQAFPLKIEDGMIYVAVTP